MYREKRFMERLFLETVFFLIFVAYSFWKGEKWQESPRIWPCFGVPPLKTPCFGPKMGEKACIFCGCAV